MASVIQRGSSCRLKFRILGDVDVTSLGTPAIAISQEYAFLTPNDDQITVDAANRCVNVDLDELDTMALAENTKTQCQLAFSNSETGAVTRFPVHELTVAATLLDRLL